MSNHGTNTLKLLTKRMNYYDVKQPEQLLAIKYAMFEVEVS